MVSNDRPIARWFFVEVPEMLAGTVSAVIVNKVSLVEKAGTKTSLIQTQQKNISSRILIAFSVY